MTPVILLPPEDIERIITLNFDPTPMGKIKDSIVEWLERLGKSMEASPEDYGYTEEEILRIEAQAEGDSVTQHRLLGVSGEPAALAELLDEGEQPHYCIPVGNIEVEGAGRETESPSGELIVTEKRTLLKQFEGISVSQSILNYPRIDLIEISEELGSIRLTIQAGGRTFTMRTVEWGDELKSAAEMVEHLSEIKG